MLLKQEPSGYPSFSQVLDFLSSRPSDQSKSEYDHLHYNMQRIMPQ